MFDPSPAEADYLIRQYEAVSFADVHGPTLPFFPTSPSHVLDVGAGSGRDAAALARCGHTVVAVEPSDLMRVRAERLHEDQSIMWLDDRLPDLARVRALGLTFDVVLLSAVWFLLDAGERVRSMPSLADLLAPGGRLLLTLRHGPPPPGRILNDITVEEVVAMGSVYRLEVLHIGKREDALGRTGVKWSDVVMAKPEPVARTPRRVSGIVAE